jgi:hypothetical protein
MTFISVGLDQQESELDVDNEGGFHFQVNTDVDGWLVAIIV